MESRAEKRLWKVFSEFIRLRDAAPFTGYVKCFTCPAVKHWKEMDCGHGISRQHASTKYNEVNNHGQCKHCNGFNGGMTDVYAKEVDKRYGKGTWDKLRIASRQIVKRGNVDFEIMHRFYAGLVAKLKKEKSL